MKTFAWMTAIVVILGLAWLWASQSFEPQTVDGTTTQADPTSPRPEVNTGKPRSEPVNLLAVSGINLDEAPDVAALLDAGVLRHLGVPYAHFVTGSNDGLDVELIQRFAARLNVRYEYVPSDWGNLIPNLIGKKVTVNAGQAVLGDDVPIKGDLIANGLTVLDWRRQVLDYSIPTFPTQIWLVARGDSPLQPIVSTGSIQSDIDAVKAMLRDRTLLYKSKTCLEPSLYGLADTGAQMSNFEGQLNDIAPAIIAREAETSILDVPDSLVALEKWPGQIKVIGPISEQQTMAVGFRKTSPRLRELFNLYMNECWQNGSYEQLVRKYYPTAFVYYPEFFAGQGNP